MGSYQLSALSWAIVFVVGLSPMIGVAVIRFLGRLLRRRTQGKRTTGASGEREEGQDRHRRRTRPPD